MASRSVTPVWGASAISGEYLSAASFLGVAGLVLAYGADALWYPVGFVAGYLVLLLLVAAPLRRSGAYTVPDFAELRLGSLAVRRTASVLVVVVGTLYLVPQLQGAGLALRTVTGAPVWVGAVVVAVVVTVNVAGGGMRSATFVQGFQYWLKLTAITVPALVLLLAWQGDGRPDLAGPAPPAFPDRTTVRIDTTVRVDVVRDVDVRLDGRPRRLTAGVHVLRSGNEVVFPAGADVPHVEGVAASSGHDWARPLSGAGGAEHPLYATYALVLATFLGTMGLPHVLVRFYTNADGAAARRTTLWVLALLGGFYLVPTVYAALGRVYAPEVLLTGRTDAVVLALPTAVLGGGVLGSALEALLVAGAFAAFLSTSSGLVVSTAGVLVQDVLGGTVAGFRRGTLLAAGVPLALALLAVDLPVAQTVGLAFAVAASTFCPLLVLGIWWRGLTAPGAIAGLVVGGAGSISAVAWTLAQEGGTISATGWVDVLLAQPAAWSVPLAVIAMVLVSRATASRAPAHAQRFMVRLHTPEALELDRS
ncbi:MAG: Na+/solute symporter [Frankiales bacterium]|nr:Na+/solute symporter [Frankiales bacterium]